MHIGHVLSFFAAICCIAQCFSYNKTHDYLGFIESLLLAASSWFFDVHAAIFIFLISALTYLLRALNIYRYMNPIPVQFIVILGVIILNNRGWIVVFPILIMWWFVLERPARWRYIRRHELVYSGGSSFAFVTREINLAMWIAYSALIGDFCTFIVRSVFFAYNILQCLKEDIFSRKAIERRRYLRHARKYKRYI